MTDINTVTLTGRLTRDAEIKYLQTGTAIANFSIANNQYGGKDRGETVHYFDCVLFGKVVDAISGYLTKGTQVTINGVLQQDRWTGDDGKTKSKVKIKVDQILLGGRDRKSDGFAEPGNAEEEYKDDNPF